MTTEIPLKGSFEILAEERNKTWKVLKTFTVTNEQGKKKTVKEGFEHDRYTFAPDLPDEVPAIVHDCCYADQKWDDGTDMTQLEADRFLRFLMKQSANELTRNCADNYYRGVRFGGWPIWYLRRWGLL